MNDGTALVRCIRCGVALTPRRPFVGGVVAISLEHGDADGPCISPQDGSVELMHRYVRVEARSTHDMPSGWRLGEAPFDITEYDPDESPDD